MIKKQGDKWLVDSQPGGRGHKRYRKSFSTKAEALRFERTLQAKVQENPFFEIIKRDNRRLTEIIDLWYINQGYLLSTGKATVQRLKAASNKMGNPLCASDLRSAFAVYRAARSDVGIKAATLNRELLAFKSVFSGLGRLGLWKNPNPFAEIHRIKHQQPAMGFLTDDQIKVLLARLKVSRSDAYLVACICLSTGARWREGQNLKRSDVSPGLITFAKTKSKKARSVPIDDGLYRQIVAVLDQRKFTDCYSAFSVMLAETGIELPDGQRTHVLRHTFASHFMMNRGNILTLQKVLGHSSLEMTMKYAHLSPDYLLEVLEKKPALTIG